MKTLFYIFLALCSTLVTGQDVEFTASVSARDVTTDDVLVLKISYNKRGKFTAPQFKDFDASGGHQSSSESIYISGGQMIQKSQFSRQYRLRPKKSGKLTIESATLIVDGKKYRTVPIQIEVKKGSGNNARPSGGQFANNQKFIARINASTSEIYKGQHLTIVYKMYSPFNFRQLVNLELPSHTGFWKTSLSDTKQQSYNVEVETINGRRYYVVTLERELLISKQSGELTLGPFNVEALITDGWRSEHVKAKSNTLKINVKPLPSGEPGNFSGAVGKFNIAAEASRTEINEDADGVDLKITVSGTGNIEFMDDPTIDLPREFDIFPPETEHSIQASASGTKGKKHYNYFIVPLANGKYDLGPFQFSYFDPETGTYKTAKTETLPITVNKPDLLDEIAADPSKKINVQSVKELRYIKTDSDLVKNPVFLIDTIGFWGGIAGPLLLFIGLLVVKKRKRDESEEERILRKAKAASKMAKQRFQQAKAKLDNEEHSEFIIENLKALYAYLSEKLNLKVHDMSKDRIRDILLTKGAPQETVEQYVDLIRDCEIARYGGQDQDFKAIYDSSIHVVESLNEALGGIKTKSKANKVNLTLLFILISGISFGSSFKEANDLYKEGLYVESAAMYDSLIQDGYVSSELYFNAGNAFYKSNQLGKSILYFSKANKLDPDNADILYNLDSIAKPAVLDNIELSEMTGVKKAAVLMITNKGRNFWSVSGLIALLLSMAGLIWYLFSKSGAQKKIGFYAGVLLLGASITCIVFSFVQRSYLLSEDKGVIMETKVDVLTEPSSNASISFALHEGCIVEILESNKDWCRIEVGSNQGWVEKVNLERI